MLGLTPLHEGDRRTYYVCGRCTKPYHDTVSGLCQWCGADFHTIPTRPRTEVFTVTGERRTFWGRIEKISRWQLEVR